MPSFGPLIAKKDIELLEHFSKAYFNSLFKKINRVRNPNRHLRGFREDLIDLRTLPCNYLLVGVCLKGRGHTFNRNRLLLLRYHNCLQFFSGSEKC